MMSLLFLLPCHRIHRQAPARPSHDARACGRKPAQHGRRRFRPHDARTRVGGKRDTACAALTESVHSLCRACGQLLCVPVPRVRAATGAQQRPVPPGLRTTQGRPVFPAGRCACVLCIQATCIQVICIRPLVCRSLHPAACCRLSVIVGLLPARLAAAAERHTRGAVRPLPATRRLLPYRAGHDCWRAVLPAARQPCRKGT